VSNHDVREEWAARLQCADVGVDFPWLTEDGCDVWLEQSEAAQEHYRNLLHVALSAGLQIPPPAAVSAAAPDEREALACVCDHPAYGARGVGPCVLHDRLSLPKIMRACVNLGYQEQGYRCSSHGWVGELWSDHMADVATAWFAARPAPVVSGVDVERALDQMRAWAPDEWGPINAAQARTFARALGITVADAPAADVEGGQE
jgi:hypothetical protein